MEISLTAAECRRRALLAADWFVNTQIVNKQPAFSADHGRIIYNYHLPSGLICRGLSWSHGRAIMCLMGAWQLTGQQKYLDTAFRCGQYLRFALQVMDSRDKRIFGCFREEVPDSDYCYPRDAIEGAFGLLLLYLATGDNDYLERCEIFADWYLNHAIDPAVRWPRGAILLFNKPDDRFPLKFFQAGGAPFFWHLYQVTGAKRYVRDGLMVLADGLLERFIDSESGAMLSPTLDRHHAIEQDGKTFAINDDGASIALTCAHAAGQNSAKRQAKAKRSGTIAGVLPSSKYLDAARRYADWIIEKCPRPIPLFAATGMHAITLTEVAALTGEKRYTRFARQLMARQARLQVISPRKLDRHGAFRGEDEPVRSYVPGSRPRDFVTTRCTAYATLALLRLHGKAFGPAYSALGLEPFQKLAAAGRSV